MNQSIRRIDSIQSLRGIAALLVVVHHAGEQLGGLPEWLIPLLARFGSTGVDLFFVISGFIMVVTTRDASISARTFVVRRLQRVVPLYWALTIAMAVASVVIPSAFHSLVLTPEKLALSLLFVPHYSSSFPQAIWPLLVPGWTLNFEMFFYALFALSMFASGIWRSFVLLASIASLVALQWVAGPFQSPIAITYTSPLLIEFALGAILGELFVRGRLELCAGLAVGMVLVGSTILIYRDLLPLKPYLSFFGASSVVGGLLSKRLQGFSPMAFKALGDASYSLYLTHLFALGALRVLWKWLQIPNEGGPVLSLLQLAAALSACSLVGLATYRWLERPMLRHLPNLQKYWASARLRFRVGIRSAR